jgi:uncharacterized delta-60 repeat protein
MLNEMGKYRHGRSVNSVNVFILVLSAFPFVTAGCGEHSRGIIIHGDGEENDIPEDAGTDEVAGDKAEAEPPGDLFEDRPGEDDGQEDLVSEEAAETPDTTWAKSYGAARTDTGMEIWPLPGGGALAFGHFDSVVTDFGAFWIFELDAYGNVLWQKSYGGTGTDSLRDARLCPDGGAILAGYSDSFGMAEDDVWILRLDSSGSTIWQSLCGGSNLDQAWSITRTREGGYILVGETHSFGAGDGDVLVMKLDEEGSVTWQRAYGGEDWDRALGILQTSDGGYVVVGHTASFGMGSQDAWVLKLDPDGAVIWQKAFGGEAWDQANDVLETDDGGIILAGHTQSFGADLHDYDVWIIRLNADGEPTWQKRYRESGWDEANAMEPTSDGGLILAGYTDSWGSDPMDMDILLLKLDILGNILWQKIYQGSGWEQANAVHELPDGGYMVTGTIGPIGSVEDWILRLDASGNIDGPCPDGMIMESYLEVVPTDVVPTVTTAFPFDTDLHCGFTSIGPATTSVAPITQCASDP